MRLAAQVVLTAWRGAIGCAGGADLLTAWHDAIGCAGGADGGLRRRAVHLPPPRPPGLYVATRGLPRGEACVRVLPGLQGGRVPRLRHIPLLHEVRLRHAERQRGRLQRVP
eukprot:1494262-Pyramimonas_sp.AAC.1